MSSGARLFWQLPARNLFAFGGALWYDRRTDNGEGTAMRITESTENYMEAILILQQQNGAVRAVDIAHYLGFSKPTISQYMKQYAQQGLIEVNGNGHIALTDEGRAIAENIFERHQVITAVFAALGVPEEIAREDACKVEHDLSDVTFQCMKEHYWQYLHHRGEVRD